MGRKNLLLIALTMIAVAALGVLFWLRYENHLDHSGWAQKEGRTVYLDVSGKPVQGWREIDGDRFYFDENGTMCVGWQEIDGLTYYLGSKGALQTGWVETDTGRYYLNETGNPLQGWKVLDEKNYFFLENGMAALSWQEVDGKRYYFDNQGCMVTGWLDRPEGRYFFSSDGVLYTGSLITENGTFLLDDNGRMCTGWADLTDGRRFFSERGIMVTGWQEIDGKLYFFQDNGTLQTGWVQQEEYRYYLTEEGAATGPTEIDGETLFFTPKGICVRLVNYNHPLSLYFIPELVQSVGGMWIDPAAEESLRQMVKACVDAGFGYQITCGFRSAESQRQLVNMADLSGQGIGTAAYPGQSEHQLGLAVDIVCFGETNWLMEHCWEYGFILRYPEGKEEITHISGEFWHFRYVGREVSMDMRDSGLCLEEYLGAA